MESKDYVGKFVKANGHHGTCYGMIDSEFGNRLGLIWSDKDSWTEELIDVENVDVLTSQDDVAKARLSAKNYLLRERASLKARIARKLKMDNAQTLQEMLDFVVRWISRLSE